MTPSERIVRLAASVIVVAAAGLSGMGAVPGLAQQGREGASETSVEQVEAEPRVPVRSWQFHEMDSAYVARTLDRAPGYGVNTAVFAGDLIGEVMDLYRGDPGAIERLESTALGRTLRSLAHRASGLDVRVWIRVREPADVPERFRSDDRIDLDREELWTWLRRRYERLFADYPEFAGVLLTVHESEYEIFDDDEVVTSMSRSERVGRLIRTVFRACSEYDRALVIQTFLEEGTRPGWLAEALRELPPEVTIQSSTVAPDRHPYYPHNPMIGAFEERRQVVEFDASAEHTGKNRIPYTSPSYFLYRWRYALQYPGVVGYNALLDHGGYDALGTPNAINLYALNRGAEDPGITPGQVWKEWTTERYGARAAGLVERALKPTFEIVNRSFFPLEAWMTDRSRLPDYTDADGHLSGSSAARQHPGEPRYRRLKERLDRPDPDLLERVLAEKDTAAALAEESLLHLRRARPFLTDGTYADLEWRFSLLRHVTEVWRFHAEAFFGYRVLAEGYRVPGLARRVDRAIAGLHRRARVARIDPHVGEEPPGAPANVEAVADELELRLERLLERWRESGGHTRTERPWPRHTIDASSRGADGTRLADVNGDDRPDVTTGWEEGGLARTYLHPGRERIRRSWPSVTVGRTPSVEDAVPVDLDGNGRTDVLSASEGSARSLFVHWAPPPHRAYSDSSAWTSESIPVARDRMQWMYAAPIRIEDTLHLAVGAKNEGARVGLLRLPPDPRRTADWSWHPLSEAGWIMSIAPADMDGDGDLDLLLSDRRGPLRGVRWLEQPGPSESGRAGWRNHFIGGRDHEVMFLDRSDVTGDGRPDVTVATRSDTLLLFERTGPTDFERHVVRLPPGTGTAKSVATGDLDGDGSVDLVVSCENADGRRGLFWLSHPAGAPWSEWVDHPLGGTAGTKFDLVRLVDLDGDGDLDVVTSEEREQLGVLWYENPSRSPGY